jgi:anti-sigma factor RsiW
VGELLSDEELLEAYLEENAALAAKHGRPASMADYLAEIRAERAARKAAEAALAEAREAMAGLLPHMVGSLPTQGRLRDNDDSRKALARIIAVLESQS